MSSGPPRLASLDVFRGLTVAAMIVVNNPGNWNSVYPPLLHVAWHGWTVADLVFPFFIFIMGMAMPLAFARRLGARDGGVALYRHIGTRAALLIALGLFLNLAIVFPHLERLRLPGVLQRIGVTYLIASVIVLRTQSTRVGNRQLAVTSVWQIGIAIGLLLAHWALLALMPFTGHVTGALTADDNLASAVDKALFGANTLTPLGDPEGLVGVVSSVGTALLGATAGWWLLASTSARRRIVGLAIGGGLAVLVGMAWAELLPLNKALWTGSYAMFASGLAALTFGACYLVVDVFGERLGASLPLAGRQPAHDLLSLGAGRPSDATAVDPGPGSPRLGQGRDFLAWTGTVDGRLGRRALVACLRACLHNALDRRRETLNAHRSPKARMRSVIDCADSIWPPITPIPQIRSRSRRFRRFNSRQHRWHPSTALRAGR